MTCFGCAGEKTTPRMVSGVRVSGLFGFLLRGLIYFVIGLLALQLPIGAGGATTSPTSAIEVIGRQLPGEAIAGRDCGERFRLLALLVFRGIMDPWGLDTNAEP